MQNGIAPGAYCSIPILNSEGKIENPNKDRVGYIYITNLSKYSETRAVYGSKINYSILIHELGHAWAAQIEEYNQEKAGWCFQKVGACTQKFKISETSKGQYEVELVEMDGVFIEEALNSIEEEKTLCRLLGVKSVAEIQGYIKSSYQGNMTTLMECCIRVIGELPFSKLRFLKDDSMLIPYGEMLEDTKSCRDLCESRYVERKKGIFQKIDELDVSDSAREKIRTFFETNNGVYFRSYEGLDFFSILNNVLEQFFCMTKISYYFSRRQYNWDTKEITPNEKNINIYNDICMCIFNEIIDPLKEAKDTIKKYNDTINHKNMQGLTYEALKGGEPTRSEINRIQRVIESDPKKEVNLDGTTV